VKKIALEEHFWTEGFPHTGKLGADLWVRVVSVSRYPYKIFCRLRGDAVEILHIRHTARRPWTDNIE
jgi:plasmid stabilization system protein ParE